MIVLLSPPPLPSVIARPDVIGTTFWLLFLTGEFTVVAALRDLLGRIHSTETRVEEEGMMTCGDDSC